MNFEPGSACRAGRLEKAEQSGGKLHPNLSYGPYSICHETEGQLLEASAKKCLRASTESTSLELFLQASLTLFREKSLNTTAL